MVFADLSAPDGWVLLYGGTELQLYQSLLAHCPNRLMDMSGEMLALDQCYNGSGYDTPPHP